MDESAIEAEYQDEERPEVRGQWAPATLADVDWCLRRMAECQRDVDAIDEQLAQAVSAATAKAEKLKAAAARGVAFFEARAQFWASSNREQVVIGKKKSRSFLHGIVGFRKIPGRLVVQDKDALERWLLAQPPERGLYRTKIEPEMKALQALANDPQVGEVPPGCDLEPETEKLTVKAELPGSALAKREE